MHNYKELKEQAVKFINWRANYYKGLGLVILTFADNNTEDKSRNIMLTTKDCNTGLTINIRHMDFVTAQAVYS